MTVDLQIPISVEEFDAMTEKRIMRMIRIQSERLEEKHRRMEEERKRAERESARKKIMHK